MLGGIGGRRTGRQRMKWLDGITDSMHMSLGELGARAPLSPPGFGDSGSPAAPRQLATGKGFGIVNKVEIDVFLELSYFFDDPVDVGNLISGSSAFCKNQLEHLEVHGSCIAEIWLGEF